MVGALLRRYRRRSGRAAGASAAILVAALAAGGGPLALAPPPAAAATVHADSSSGADVLAFGSVPRLGGLASTPVTARTVTIVATPDGGGYWLVGADGGVFCFGDARFHGSTGAVMLQQPIVGAAATPDGAGYWLVAADGGVFAFGDARFHGSTGGVHLNSPIVGMAPTRDGAGYWLVAADGGVFAFGDARFRGSTGGVHLASPVVGMAATPDGAGYWLVAADGGIFTFGSAGFHGSTGGVRLQRPIVGMAATADGRGYWLAAADGGVFDFGDAPFHGSGAGRLLDSQVVGVARGPGGYWLAERGVYSTPFTPALKAYLAGLPETVTAAVEDLGTGVVYTYDPGPSLVLGSTVKVQILGTLLSQAQAAARPLTATEQSLATAMIEVSDNSAGQALFDEVGGAPAIQAWDDSIGLTGTFVYPAWGISTSTATDQITLLGVFARPNRYLDDASRAYGLSLLGHVEPSQVFGINVGPPAPDVLAAKTGRMPFLGVRNGIACVDGDGRDYLIAILTQNGPSDQEDEVAMEPISYNAWTLLGP